MPTPRIALLWLACVLSAACNRGSTVATNSPAAVEWFTDRAHESGLDFTHFNGMSGHFYYPEIMAPGVALLDYDNDGDLDVYVTQGQMLSVDGKTPWPRALQQCRQEQRGPPLGGPPDRPPASSGDHSDPPPSGIRSSIAPFDETGFAQAHPKGSDEGRRVLR